MEDVKKLLLDLHRKTHVTFFLKKFFLLTMEFDNVSAFLPMYRFHFFYNDLLLKCAW